MNPSLLPLLHRGAFAILAAAVILVPMFSPALRHHAPGLAVIAGALFALSVGNPFTAFTRKLVAPLLGTAIVGMGFGMDLFAVLHAGATGFLYTFIGIATGLGVGLLLGKLMGLDRDAMYLISVGTSICGGSAIAAAAPVLRAQTHAIAIASATVFALNAIALLIFPPLGHLLGMNQVQFGYWSALGIHDTSSVVGATLQYGPLALETGTTVKLARALWIVPVTLLLSWLVAVRTPGEKRGLKFKLPWFIPGFIGAATLVACLPALAPAGTLLKTGAQYLMILTLFLIGANLNRQTLRELGFKPVLHGLFLWIILATAWGVAIPLGWITPK